MRRLIFGCGYLGGRVAQRWREEGEPVFAVTRSATHAAQFAQQGLQPILADVTRPETLVGLPAADSVLYAIGYDRRAEASRQEVYVEGLRHVLAALPRQTGRMVLVSSTGVYGSAAGQWVDEETPCRPTREAGKALLAAEQLLRGDPLGRRGVILRMAGIYGPGRIPRMAELVRAGSIAVSDQGYLNLIHVDDAARVVVAAEWRAQPPRTYVVSDGQPCRRREFYRRLASLLGLREPSFVEPESDPAASRGRDDKRVDNSRMLAELRVPLQYSSYWEGLASLVTGDAAAEGPAGG